MNLYPCTRNPPYTNVSGHLTPICPELRVKDSRGDTSTSKLKADAIGTYRPKSNPNTKWADNPQAAEIDALIERSRQLTTDETKALDVVYEAVGEAAYTAAYTAGDAAWYTAYSAGDAGYVAAYSAGDTAWRAGRAGYAAAYALVIRDLIDGNTPWNQEAYDLLTEPWVKVIGPVHPDDVVR